MNQATARVLGWQETHETTTMPKTSEQVVVKKRVSRKAQRTIVACTLLLMVSGLFVVAQYSAVTLQGKNVQQLRKELIQEKNAVEYLRVEVNRLQSLERIENIATTKLGMHAPKGSQVLAMNQISTDSKKITDTRGVDTSEGRPEIALSNSTVAPVGNNAFVAAITRFFNRFSSLAFTAHSGT